MAQCAPLARELERARVARPAGRALDVAEARSAERAGAVARLRRVDRRAAIREPARRADPERSRERVAAAGAVALPHVALVLAHAAGADAEVSDPRRSASRAGHGQ